MLKRIACIAAVGAFAAACASNPAPAAGTPAAAGSPAASTPGASVPNTVTIANMAGTTAWLAEERLMPQDPVLALVTSSGGSVDKPQGAVISCNAANGKITAKIGHQPVARVGKEATYSLRAGPGAPRPVEGVFTANAKTPGEADFSFPLSSADVLGMGQLDIISVLTDGGEVQWAFVKDPAAQVQAKYVASLKGLAAEGRNFIEYCNPK